MGIVVAVPVGVAVALLLPTQVAVGNAPTTLVTIPSGATTVQIAETLAQSKVLKSKTLFRLAVKLTGTDGKLTAGDYAFPKGRSPITLAQGLAAGRFRTNDVSVTIPEGFTDEQIAARLDAAGVVASAEFLGTSMTPSTELGALVPELPVGASLEGYLFPDTYRFLKYGTADAVARRFLQNFASKRATLPAPTGSASGHTLHEAVILASILEREVRTETERRTAADIFWRRLAAGIALQSDVTTAYAVGKTPDRLTAADFDNPSPFNTYAHRGLPPGPIANPGSVSLAAALNPLPNEFFYFLTNPLDGSAVYAKTFAEHLANKAKYLQR